MPRSLPLMTTTIKNVHVDGLEINAPRLRRFRYNGPLSSLSLCPRPLELEQVDLDFSGRYNNTKNKDPKRDLATFCDLLRTSPAPSR
jgi:hypothetical protein